MKRVLRFAIPVVVIGALLLSAAPASAKKAPPAKRFYFALLMGMDTPYSVGAACLKFTNSTMTVLNQGVSGPWEMESQDGDQTTFSSAMSATVEILGQQVPVTMDGTGVTNNAGAKSSMGGALSMIIELAGVTQNVSFSGREVPKKSKCTKLANKFNKAMEAAGVAVEIE
jgi:hypothetical protein